MKLRLFFLPFLLLILVPCLSQAQWQHKTINFDNTSRDYWVYIPSSYDPINPVPLVVTLHGMGDNDTNFRNVGFNLVADTANFIVLVPNALIFNSTNPIVQAVIGGSRTWNSGAGMNVPIVGDVFPNNEINDVGFINEMVDLTIQDYAINQQRVYICGFSMGGFMTQRMAIESNGRYAAFATAAGTFGTGLINPNPGRAIPIAHFNGTIDEKVNWQSGNPLFQTYVDSMITFWVQNNNCDTPPIHELLPDSQADGFTVEHDVYPNGDNGTVVEVFKVNDAAHVWLGFNNDISYTIEMWKFFSRYSFATAGLNEISNNHSVTVYPNPVSDKLTIELSGELLEPSIITLYNMEGREIMQIESQQKSVQLQLGNLNSGLYLLNITSQTLNSSKRIIVE